MYIEEGDLANILVLENPGERDENYILEVM